MNGLHIAKLSDSYVLRRLDEKDTDALYALCLTNYAPCWPGLSRERLAGDLRALPPGCVPEQKYYLGCETDGELLAALDLILGYPDETRAYIGFFLVHGAHAGRGLGTAMIGELCAALKDADVQAIRLAYDKSDPRASHFWTKNGFRALCETDHEFGHMVVAEKIL